MLSGAVYGIGKYVILLLAVVAIFTTGTYLFTSGFLLSRHEIDVRSSCSKSKNSILWNNTDKNTCWTVPRISKVYTKFVVILIDALRFDFANYDDNTSKILPYTNRLSIFHELAKKHGCSSTRLFRFRADAPTTTMQRIKGLTTGSFPTFIDVSNNFDSAEITEDNFIDQFVESSNRNITFLGDDTWLKLFPGRFATSFPFPSFDVKNLHLVDDGIQEHLVSELQKDNWNMLIAHFIGVDHCGHRYGPLHSEMSAKLEEMDKMIRTVVNNMGDDTLLIVMGDHGMTQTGDHGGETLEEVDSALFAFHPGGKFSRRQLKNQNSCYADLIQQIDLVPTMSVLLGVPIPFSNLGTIIPDLIPSTEQFATDKSSTSDSLSEALYVNAKQAVMQTSVGTIRLKLNVLNKSTEELQEHPIYYIDEVMDFSDSTICLFLSGGSLIVLVFLFWHFLKREANLWNPYSAAVLCSTRLIPLATVCIIGHWQLQTLAAKELDALPTFYVTFLPRCAYCLLLLSFLLWWLSPLSVHLTYKDRYGRYRDEHSVLPADDAAARHYQQLLKKVEEEDEQNNKTSSRAKPEERKGLWKQMYDALKHF
ncbi:unnamed protein product [Clavelina lepadiformis]|uniref:GPI ethanolamine phosphate transferase 3 n=1 Tax=Clavelina lepadiformis TaxID=159417 RepID=A0ABP0FED0_CLALP